MAYKPGHTPRSINIPDAENDTLKERSTASGKSVTALINDDIAAGNKRFRAQAK